MLFLILIVLASASVPMPIKWHDMAQDTGKIGGRNGSLG